MSTYFIWKITRRERKRRKKCTSYSSSHQIQNTSIWLFMFKSEASNERIRKGNKKTLFQSQSAAKSGRNKSVDEQPSMHNTLDTLCRKNLYFPSVSVSFHQFRWLSNISTSKLQEINWVEGSLPPLLPPTSLPFSLLHNTDSFSANIINIRTKHCMYVYISEYTREAFFLLLILLLPFLFYTIYGKQSAGVGAFWA